VAGHPLGIAAPRPLPLPADALQRPEARFDPDAQAVPDHADVIGGEVGQEHPRRGLPGFPDDDERARLPFRGLEGDAGAGPAISDRAGRRGGRGRAGRASRAGRAVRRPLPLSVGRQGVPYDRQGRVAIQDADGEDDAVAMRGGVEGEGEVGAVPPGVEPAQQGSEAERDLPIAPAEDALLAPRTEEVAQPLAGRFVLAEGHEGGEHGILAGAMSEEGAVDPEGEPVGRGGRTSGKRLKAGRSLIAVVCGSAGRSLRGTQASACAIDTGSSILPIDF
jgi:hypothetical protein